MQFHHTKFCGTTLVFLCSKEIDDRAKLSVKSTRLRFHKPNESEFQDSGREGQAPEQVDNNKL